MVEKAWGNQGTDYAAGLGIKREEAK